MFIFKCFLLLFIFGELNAMHDFANRACPYPRLEHGRVRTRPRSKLVKFICYPGYILVGNKYATCRDKKWDVPFPVCVKPGCTLPNLGDNLLGMPSHGDAWVVFFCFPGFELVGSPSIFCDGKKWNSSIPTCVDSTAPTKLSCDFEDPNICGWKDDDLHDFDWKRYNRKTPSSFLNTGPSYDHTFGEGGSGYYMYIESTSRLENDTARLLSPIYDASIAKDGCFSFFYHMFGKATGGLRVYQKPENYPMLNLMRAQGDERQKYMLFEKWGDQGDLWYDAVLPLRNFSDSFQIVIEGIRGRSYTSDIAIDDVAILHGENCTAAAEAATTPSTGIVDSCAGRCHSVIVGIGCGCTLSCTDDGNCCPDFFEVCLFDAMTTDADLPETQKLVLSTTTLQSTEPSTTSTTTEKPTTKQKSTTILKPSTNTQAEPTTAKTYKTTPKILPTLVFKTTTKVYNGTGVLKKDNFTTVKPTTIVTTKSIKVVTTTLRPLFKTTISRKVTKKEIEFSKDMLTSQEESRSQSSGLKSTILAIAGILCVAGFIWLVALARSAKGREVMSRLRGRTFSDPEVRYLNSDVDDD